MRQRTCTPARALQALALDSDSALHGNPSLSASAAVGSSSSTRRCVLAAALQHGTRALQPQRQQWWLSAAPEVGNGDRALSRSGRNCVSHNTQPVPPSSNRINFSRDVEATAQLRPAPLHRQQRHSAAHWRVGTGQDKQHHSFQQAARQLQLRRLDAPEQPQHQQIILRVRDTVAARARVKGGHTGFESAAASRGPKLLCSE
jgi:hypothetical protein